MDKLKKAILSLLTVSEEAFAKAKADLVDSITGSQANFEKAPILDKIGGLEFGKFNEEDLNGIIELFVPVNKKPKDDSEEPFEGEVIYQAFRGGNGSVTVSKALSKDGKLKYNSETGVIENKLTKGQAQILSSIPGYDVH